MAEEQKLLDDTTSMLRLKKKAKLVKDCSIIFKQMSESRAVFDSRTGKKFRTFTEKSVLKDFIKGMKEIDKKIPVFVELPKVESAGNGGYSVGDSVDVDPVEIVYEEPDLLEHSS